MSHKLYVFDLDGTLYRGDQPTLGALDTLTELRKRGHHLRFLTNNSSAPPEQVASKLTRLGFQADPSEVATSGMAAAALMVERGLRTAAIVGEAGLAEVLNRSQIEVEPLGGCVEAVVVGIDREFTYERCRQAMQSIHDGAVFIATNRDKTYPLEGGRLIPGAGAIVAAIEACSGRRPIVAGKPSPAVLLRLCAEAGFLPSQTTVVGDRWETDIVCAQKAGCEAILALTGVSNRPRKGARFLSDLRELLLA